MNTLVNFPEEWLPLNEAKYRENIERNRVEVMMKSYDIDPDPQERENLVAEDDVLTKFCECMGLNEAAVRMLLDKPLKQRIPIWNMTLLTLEQAACYTGLGINKLRTLTDDPNNYQLVVWNGSKRMIKRKKLDEYLDKAYSV